GHTAHHHAGHTAHHHAGHTAHHHAGHTAHHHATHATHGGWEADEGRTADVAHQTRLAARNGHDQIADGVDADDLVFEVMLDRGDLDKVPANEVRRVPLADLGQHEAQSRVHQHLRRNRGQADFLLVRIREVGPELRRERILVDEDR